VDTLVVPDKVRAPFAVYVFVRENRLVTLVKSIWATFVAESTIKSPTEETLANSVNIDPPEKSTSENSRVEITGYTLLASRAQSVLFGCTEL
jgi:hypothetical protein